MIERRLENIQKQYLIIFQVYISQLEALTCMTRKSIRLGESGESCGIFCV